MIEVENTDMNICSQKFHTNEKSHASEHLWSESHFRLVYPENSDVTIDAFDQYLPRALGHQFFF